MPSKKAEKEVDEFMDSLEGLTLEQQIDALGQEILANAFVTIRKVRRYGKKSTIKEQEVQAELQTQFKYIQSTYLSLKKMNRVQANPGNNFEENLLEKIKQKKSSIGNIVTRVPKQ
jgi:hypothetical protein